MFNQHHSVPFVVSVTGHRDIHPDDLEFVRAQVFQLIALIAAGLPTTLIQFWTALADGADQLFAEQVLRLKKLCINPTLNGADRIQLVVPLPMPLEIYCSEQVGGEAGSRSDGLSYLEARAAFESRVALFTSAAAQVFVVPSHQSGGDWAAGVNVENEPYVRLAHFLSQNSDIVIAIWDGQTQPAQRFPRLPGGTQDLVQGLLTDSANRENDRADPCVKRPLREVIHVYTRRSAPSSAGLACAGQNGFAFAVVVKPKNSAINGGEIEHVLTSAALAKAPMASHWLSQPRQATKALKAYRTWRKVLAKTELLVGHSLDEPSQVVLYQIYSSVRLNGCLSATGDVFCESWE
ncbi:MAG: hypothetical protein IPN53_01570 [Comamonadaceae bacterium]|nr:hypothetical protein [Comamonadaceae bacterium]